MRCWSENGTAIFADRARMVYSQFVSLRAAVVVRITRSNGPVAQLAEQQTLNLLVEGSIPSGLTTKHN